MVVPIKAYGVHILGREVRRIGIEEGVRPVVVLDERFDVLILQDNVWHSIFKILDESGELSDIEGL